MTIEGQSYSCTITPPSTGTGGEGGGSGGSTGTGGFSGGTGGGDTGGSGGGTPPDACEACINANCSSQAQACGMNQSCAALIECAFSCSDEACVDNCANSYPEGIDDANNYLNCVFGVCEAACSG